MTSISPAHFVTLLPDRVGDDQIVTMRDVLLSMTPEARKSFVEAIKASEFADAWRRLSEDFAAVACPEQNYWSEPHESEVLDEIDIRIKELASIVCLTNGRLMLRVYTRSTQPTLIELPTRLMTPAEFLFYVNVPIKRYLDELINPRIKRLQRASAVLSTKAPMGYRVQYATGADVNAAITSAVLYARCPEQLHEWAKRRHYRILDAQPTTETT